MTQELSADYADYTDWRKTTTNEKGRQTKWRPHSLICEICVICGLVFQLIFFGDANSPFVLRLLHNLLRQLSRHGIVVREDCAAGRSEEHTSEIQSLRYFVYSLLLVKTKTTRSK